MEKQSCKQTKTPSDQLRNCICFLCNIASLIYEVFLIFKIRKIYKHSRKKCKWQRCSDYFIRLKEMLVNKGSAC